MAHAHTTHAPITGTRCMYKTACPLWVTRISTRTRCYPEGQGYHLNRSIRDSDDGTKPSLVAKLLELHTLSCPNAGSRPQGLTDSPQPMTDDSFYCLSATKP